MASIHIRDIQPATLAALKRLARSHHRSLQGELRVILDRAALLAPPDEDETRLYQCYLDWFYAIEPRLRPRGWDPDRNRKMEELMEEVTVMQRNTDRWLERHGKEKSAERLAHVLVRLAGRRFGADTGQRLGAKLENVDDPDHLDRLGDLIVDCETGKQSLASIDRADAYSS